MQDQIKLRRALPYIELASATAAAGLWYLQSGGVWRVGAWPLTLLIVPWLLRSLMTGLTLRPAVLDVLLWIFLASAALGVWVAYDPGPAWSKFWLIVGAIGLYYALAHQPDIRHLYTSLALFGLGGAALSIYFFAANDWTTAAWAAHAVKAPALVDLGKHISAWLPSLPRQKITPDVMGGLQATLMPMYVALLVLGRRDRATGLAPRVRRWLPALVLVAAAVTGLAWLVSTSRGAWLSVLGVALVWGVWHGSSWWMRRRNVPQERAWQVRQLILSGVLLIGSALLAAAMLMILAGRLPGLGDLVDRVNLWRDSLLLARDYRFTGAGLGMFSMQYSIYTLLIHVLYLTQSYDIFLDLLIEQGLIGLSAYLLLVSAGLVLGLRWLRSATNDAAWIIEAGLACLGAMFVNGMLSDALYGSRGVLLLFVPFGLIVAARGVDGRETADHESMPRATRRPAGAWRIGAAGVILAALIVAGVAEWRPVLAAWYANLGAVEQSRAELRAYDPNHFDSPTLDQVRQRENLDNAIALFKRAESLDPANPTARQRLAGIALARGQYVSALNEMQAAWDAGHRDPVTRKLLSDADVANGRVQEGALMARGLSWADGRLAGQAWYRYWLGQDYRRAADAWTAVLILKPDDQASAAMQAEAVHRVNQ